MNQYEKSPEQLDENRVEKVTFSGLFDTTITLYKARFKELILFGTVVFCIYFVIVMVLYLLTIVPMTVLFLAAIPESDSKEVRVMQTQLLETVAQQVGVETGEHVIISEPPEESQEEAHELEEIRLPQENLQRNDGEAVRFVMNATIVMGIVSFVLLAVLSLLYLWFFAGQVRYVLELVKGEKPSMWRIFHGGKYFGRYVYYCAYVTIIIMLLFVPIFFVTFYPGINLIAGAVATLGPNEPIGNSGSFWSGSGLIVLGMFVFGLMNFYVQLIYSFGIYFIVDREESVSPAMRHSRCCVNGNFLAIFGASLVLLLLNAVLSGIVFFAAVFTAPFLLLFYVIAYLKMSGQNDRIVIPSPDQPYLAHSIDVGNANN